MCGLLHVWSATCVVGYMCGRLHVWLATCVVGYICNSIRVKESLHVLVNCKYRANRAFIVSNVIFVELFILIMVSLVVKTTCFVILDECWSRVARKHV